jgi:hypothetical protein
MSVARGGLERRIAEAGLGLAALELLFVVVTGGASLTDPAGAAAVRGAGFAWRAALVGALVVLRFGLMARGRVDRSRLALVLLLLPSLFQLHHARGRLGGDGISYYVYTRSLVKDLDLDFTNEYTHFGWIERADIRVKTDTGLRRSIFAVGPGLVGIPAFLVGEAIGRVQAALGGAVDLSGYGDVHVNAVALGGCLLGFAAVLLMHAVLRRHFRESTALGAAVLAWLATFLAWYMTEQPVMSHTSSAAGAALVLLVWDKGRVGRRLSGYLALGLLLGAAMCLRWQNGVFLLLPAWELGRRVLVEGLPLARAAAAGGLLLLGTLVGAFPQMWAWKVLYGVFLLPAPPHGADFVRLDHPWILNTLFSSRHGLLSWTPVLWAGYLGFLPLLKRRPGLAAPLVLPLLVITYVNMCSGDWWAGGSFSNRRFECLLGVLALGIASSLDVLREAVRRRPEAVLGLGVGVFAVFNLTLVEQVRRGLVPRDDTVDGPRLVGQSARLVSDAVGFPTTWPASWIFAWQTGRSPGQYDRLVGRYLFYRFNNLKGRIAVGAAGDDAMLGEGWGPVRTADARSYRETRGPARVMAPLDVPEDLELRLLAASGGGPEIVTVSVNGRPAGRVLVGAEWAESRLVLPAALWRRELNDVVLDAGPATVRVEWVAFVQLGVRS